MGRDGIHDPDDILDAARDVVLSRGVAAATARAIAEAANAPMGSIYHRFGSRDGVLAQVWIRAAKRSQGAFLEAMAEHDDPLESAVAGALSVFDFARKQRKDAQIAVLFRREDLMREAPPELAETLRTLNEPVLRAVKRLGGALVAREGASLDGLWLAIFDLPYGAVRRHLVRGSAPPPGLRASLESAVRAVLASL